MSGPSDERPTLLVIGAGPKGLYALERLAHELGAVPENTRPRVMICETERTPGAGWVYAPGQPDCLRMNIAAEHLSAWVDESDERVSLVDWLARRGVPHSARDAYLPRRVVGDYLAEAYRLVLSDLERVADVRRISARATSMQAEAHRWRIVFDDGTSAAADEVLITIGHQPLGLDEDATEWQAHADRGHGRFIEAVFPVDRQLSKNLILADSAVVCRGFALTFVDCALALTELRGGSFSRRSPGRLAYRPSGAEPRRISPFSRSGRPMLAKPVAEIEYDSPEIRDLWSAERDRLRADLTSGRLSKIDAICERLATSARRRLALDDGSTSAEGSSNHAPFDDWLADLVRQNDRLPVVERLRQTIDVCSGRQPLDGLHAAGMAWRNLYPVIVEVVSHGGLDVDERERFFDLHARMERVAFGPPIENVQRIEALITAGVIDVRFAAAPDVETVANGFQLTNSGGESLTAPVLIDARIPAPRLEQTASPLLRSLLDSGSIRPLHGCPGAEVTPDAAAVGDDGSVTAGLSLFGRPTEGCVLGTDTLTRKLHPQIDRWAGRVAARLRNRQPNVVAAR